MISSLSPAANSELVVGMVARIGVDTKKVCTFVEQALRALGYRVEYIHVTDLIKLLPSCPELVDSPTERRLESYIDACNHLREMADQSELLALLAVLKIRSLREEPTRPRERTVYIVDQLKRPEEISFLRQIYGRLFVQISCHGPATERLRFLVSRIANDHPEAGKSAQWAAPAQRLIDRDDSEEEKPFGQRVRDAFPLADLIVDGTQEEACRTLLRRFFHALFGDFAVSPTRGEYAMNLASTASLRSLDLSRQVGAAIVTDSCEVVALGCNEVPKAGGGTYWTGDAGDARDLKVGHDINTVRKRGMVLDVVHRLREGALLAPQLADLSDTDLQARLLDEEAAPLKDSQILDSLEHGRALHAELSAITDAARLGRQTKGALLYCTTFPCHNCAKHILGAGVSQVFYLQPYPKSFVSDMYPDSIAVDAMTCESSRVPFTQFIGIAPRRYDQLFEKSRLKDKLGNLRKWVQDQSSPMVDWVIPTYIDLESIAIETIVGSLPNKDEFLGKS